MSAVRVFTVTVDGRDDGTYAFERWQDRDAFAEAVCEAGGEVSTDDLPVISEADAPAMIAAERESDR